MPGERTPDTSPANRAGSSDDEISLREHVQRQLDLQGRHFERVIEDLRGMLDERYQTQTKAVDAAFAAQQQAMTTALAAAERAVATALQSAERAVSKSEAAQEKRLEGVNEFRAQLSDQAATFVRRDDVDVRIAAITERLNDTINKVTKLDENVIARSAQRVEARSASGAVYAAIGFGISLLLAAMVVIPLLAQK